MANAVMGTNLKKKSVFIDKHGSVKEGTISENMAGDAVAGLRDANTVSKGTGGAEEVSSVTPSVPLKQCKGCSSPAKEGYDWCPSCGRMVGAI